MLRQQFYGWWVAVAAFVTMSACGATGAYAFSLFIKPLETSMYWTRTEIMLAFTIWAAASGISAPFVGRAVDRFGPSRVITGGALITAAGCLVLSTMNHLWQFYLGHTLLGLAASATGSIPLSAMISHWFVKHRGTAIGIMSAGVGVGGMIFSPLFGGLTIPAMGWRATYAIAGALTVAILVPLATLVMRDRPTDATPTPDDKSTSGVSTTRQCEPGAGKAQLLRRGNFWSIILSFFFGAFAQLGLLQNQMPYLSDIGVPVTVAAASLGMVGLFSTVGKLSAGWACDRLSASVVWAISLSLQASATLILMTITPETPGWVLFTYAVVAGLGMGGWLPTMSLLVSSNFGLNDYGTVFGAVAAAFAAGQALGPTTAGRIIDITGSYQTVFLMLLLVYVIAIVAILWTHRRQRGQ